MPVRGGVTDSDRLVAYLELKLREVTGDQSIQVTKIPPTQQYEDGPKLRVDLDGKTNVNTMLSGEPLQYILERIFPPAFEPHHVSCVSYPATDQSEEVEERGRYTLPLFVLNHYIAVEQARVNDPEVFERSQVQFAQLGA